MTNAVSWFEIAVSDLERAKKFYESVFKKTMIYMEMPDSKMYMFDGAEDKAGSMGAIVQSTKKPSTEGTMVYFEVEDVATEAALVDANGGKLLFPKTSIGQFGFICHFMDTEGNLLGIHSGK